MPFAAKYVPGVDIDTGSVEAIFIAGATIAFAKAGLWLKGWQDYEKRHDVLAPADEGFVDEEADFEELDSLELDADLDDELDLGDDFDTELDDDLLADGEPLVPGHSG